MDTRRSFIKKSAFLSGAAGIWSALPASIQNALAINPDAGSNFYDAEHIVFLMQENRSFDHAFGTLQGVRGFNDPRAIQLPDKNPVWLQTNKEGETYAPFRLNIKDTKITWMGCLPHSWDNQVDARNDGKFDKWLDMKHSGQKEFDHMPLTMGYYNRQDIPFYYSLADAFTVCDQHFCSSLTGTTPNRLHFWSGTIRDEQAAKAMARVWNGDADHNTEVSWKTYPERLEENGISWKVYQNEIDAGAGLDEEADGWLANFGDNPLEYFTQYGVRFSPEYIANLPRREESTKTAIADLEKKIAGTEKTDKQLSDWTKLLARRKTELDQITQEQKIYTLENFEKLSDHQKNIHRKGFTNNRTDPHYHALTDLDYEDGAIRRELKVPKGDILKQFRDDVNNHELPAVSWLVAPQFFSDHPDSPWFGAWYVSEVMDILTKDPAVWKKTIFILTYDENDGYFDHVPPFVAPDPYKEHVGKVSPGIDTTLEFVKHDQQVQGTHTRESAIGLGFRVPMVVASPWTRGGWVCSEIFDHTSSLQFLENFLEKKTGKKITEPNINDWRRTVCGDLTNVFRPYNNEAIKLPEFLEKEKFIEDIHAAKFKKEPNNYKKLGKADIAAVNKNAHASGLLAAQEKGIRSACALPYELYVDGNSDKDGRQFTISFNAAEKAFKEGAIGSPFYVYAMTPYEKQVHRTWNYAVRAGREEKDEWALSNFDNGHYHLRVYGPNGFFREFSGKNEQPSPDVYCTYEYQDGKRLSGNVTVKLENTTARPCDVLIKDNHYKTGDTRKKLKAGETVLVTLNQKKSYGWYDFSVTMDGNPLFLKRFAGHVETGQASKTDPLMGQMA
ncbi:MAG TPA: phospholipase C, phosphocholine-specific [Chitinophagaceae bacterium]|nr:phospholipase C, phosphocholine-specific [Chitinophagaceae bacterium]